MAKGKIVWGIIPRGKDSKNVNDAVYEQLSKMDQGSCEEQVVSIFDDNDGIAISIQGKGRRVLFFERLESVCKENGWQYETYEKIGGGKWRKFKYEFSKKGKSKETKAAGVKNVRKKVEETKKRRTEGK